MKQNKITSQNGPANLADASRRQLSASLTAVLTAATVLGFLALERQAFSQTAEANLKPGDIVYTDSGDGFQGAAIIKADPQTGEKTVISHAGYLGSFGYPNGVAIDQKGQLIVANERCLLRIDPTTGAQTLIRDARSAPGGFWNVALDQDGDILVAAEKAVLRVDPLTNQIRVVSSGGRFTLVLSVAVGEKDGDLFVTNVKYDVALGGWVGEIIRVNPHNGRQTVISRAGHLTFLLGITVSGNDIYVTGLKTHDQNFGIGQVTHVDARTGVQRVVSQGENLIRPVGISVDANGQLIVADPYTGGGFDGAIIRIDPATGRQTLIANGQGSFVNPCGVTVVPTSQPNR